MLHSETNHETTTLEAEVCEAVAQGRDVQDLVRQLTLRKISEYTHELEALRAIAGAVLRGARAGAQKELNRSKAQTDLGRTRLQDAVTGLDAALAQVALVSKLALEEATAQARQVSLEELTRAKADLEGLDALFLESLQTAAANTKDGAGAILHDLATHVRLQGSAVGTQAKDTLTVLAHQLALVGRAQAVAGLQLAQTTSSLLRQLAAGALTGLADQLHPKGKEG